MAGSDWGSLEWGTFPWGDVSVNTLGLSAGRAPPQQPPRVFWTVDGRSVDVEGWVCSKVRLGGDNAFSGACLERVARRWPSSFQQGATVLGTQENGRGLWQGKLTLPPSFSDGKALLVADGNKVDAENRSDPVLYQFSYADMASQDGDPFHRANSSQFTLTNDNRLMFQIGKAVAYAISDAAGYAGWAPGDVIVRAAGNITGTNADFDLKTWTLLGPSGTPTLQATHGLGVAPFPFDDSWAGTDDMIVVGIQAKAIANSPTAAPQTWAITNFRVNGESTVGKFDAFYASDVATDLGAKLGWDTSGVTMSNTSVLPLWLRNTDWATGGLSYVAMMDDWHWGVSPERTQGKGPYLEYAPDSQTWTVFRAGTVRPQLTPLTLYNGVVIYYTLNTGRGKSVTLMASPDPLSTQGTLLPKPSTPRTQLWEETLTDPQPDATVATTVAQNRLAMVSTPRFGGRLEIVGARDSAGRGNRYDVWPGHIVNIADWGPAKDLPQRIEDAEYRPDGVTLGVNAPTSARGVLSRLLAQNLITAGHP